VFNNVFPRTGRVLEIREIRLDMNSSREFEIAYVARHVPTFSHVFPGRNQPLITFSILVACKHLHALAVLKHAADTLLQ